MRARRRISARAALTMLVRQRGFRRLYAVRLVSQCADGIFEASLASAVFFNPEHSTDAKHAAAGFVVLLLPYSLVGPFAGVFLDRWRRQRVLQRANVLRAGLVATAALLLVTTGPTGPAFYIGALAALSVNRFYLATLGASLPRVVRADELVLANSLSTTSGTLVTFVGGAVGLAVRAVAGHGDRGSATVALTAAAVYLVSSAVARGFAPAALGPDVSAPRGSLGSDVAIVARGLVAGARHVAARREAWSALVAIGSHRFFYGVSTVASLLLYRNYFHSAGLLRAGLPGLAQLLFCGAVGVFVAAVVTPAAAVLVRKQTWMATVFALAGTVELVLGPPFAKAPLLVAAFFLGVAAQGSKICVDTIVQETVADDFRGRVFSFYDTVFNLSFVLAAVAGAFLLPANGRSLAAVVVIALGYLVTAAFVAVVGRPPRSPSRPQAGQLSR